MDYPTASIARSKPVTGSGRRRILHFIESGGLYGAERVILNLSREMRECAEFEPLVGCIVSHAEEPSDLYDEALRQGIEAIKLVIPNASVWFALPRVARQLRNMDVALLHSHGYKPSVYGFIIRLLAGIPVIATCHLWFELDKGPLKTRTMVWLEKNFYRWFPRVIAVSDSIRRVLIDSGVPPQRIRVIENGVQTPELTLSTEEAKQLRAELGVAPTTFCVLNAGRLTRQKAQDTLIEAAALLKARDVDFHILIAGEGRLRDELRRHIQMHEVEDCVSLLGFRDDVSRLLAISDALALPSLDEGMPMVLLEATANRLPVITTAVGDIPKLVSHLESGLIIRPEAPEELAAAIVRLVDEPALGRRLAKEAAQRREQKYSSGAMHQQYHQIYQQLLIVGAT